MTASAPQWPTKTREYQSHHFDSTMWNDFKFRDDDIVISTYAKSGTTWMQQIVSQLLFDGKEGLPTADMSPWLDLRVPPKEVKLPMIEAQTHRRFLKTHLPVDAIVFSPKAKYIYIGRDGRDVAWSFYNHHVNANDAYYQAVNDSPGRVGPAFERPQGDVVEYFRTWLARDGHPYWPFLGERADLVGDQGSAQRPLRPFLKFEGGSAWRNAQDRGVSRHPRQRSPLASHRRALRLRLHERKWRARCATGRGFLGRRG